MAACGVLDGVAAVLAQVVRARQLHAVVQRLAGCDLDVVGGLGLDALHHPPALAVRRQKLPRRPGLAWRVRGSGPATRGPACATWMGGGNGAAASRNQEPANRAGPWLALQEDAWAAAGAERRRPDADTATLRRVKTQAQLG